MRRAMFGIVAVLACGVLLAAGNAEVVNLSHGQFAQLLLKVLSTKHVPALDPAQAMGRTQDLGLMPQSWKTTTVLTHAEFAQVLHVMGISYVPNDPEAPVSRTFAEALLRRYRDEIIHRRGWVLGHGFSPDDYLDGDHGEGVLSPSKF